jgi:uncharacterized membrane protein YbhN (UPF0104 family)
MPVLGKGASKEPEPDLDQRETSEPVSPQEAADVGRRLRHGLITLGVLLVIVVGLLLAIPGLHGIGHAVVHMDGGWIAGGVALEVLSCLSYVLAFLQVFRRAPIRLGARVALSELAFGATVPIGGVGSVALGGWLLVERGAPLNRVAQRSAVLFLLTSAVNVITFIVAGLGLWLGIFPGPSDPLLSLLPAAAGTAVLVFFLLLPPAIERGLTGRLPPKLDGVLRGTASSIRDTADFLRRPDWRLIGAIGYLWFDIAVLLACFAALDASPPVASVVLAYQIAYLSNLVPIPGGIGVLDGSLLGMLTLYGISATTSAAATVVYHAIALLIPVVWGTVAFVILRRNRDQPLRPRLG